MITDRVQLAYDAFTGVEAIRARFAGHAYDLHRHDEWLVGVTDHGVQDFHCRGARRQSTPGRVILMEPQEAHDGQAGNSDGFAYQMLYIPQQWLRHGLMEARDPGFIASLCDDPSLAFAIRRACWMWFQPAERLARDEALDEVLAWLRPHLGRPLSQTARHDSRVARRARERLHEDLASDAGADALAAAAGAADRFQLARAFRAAFGSSPHAYLVQIRLQRARDMLACGQRPADVAAACGFADQAHLTRRFRRAYGVTPGVFRTLRTGVQDDQAALG